jgi:hypothetical protein
VSLQGRLSCTQNVTGRLVCCALNGRLAALTDTRAQLTPNCRPRVTRPCQILFAFGLHVNRESPNIAIIGVCFGIALWVLGLLCGGAGHGTYLPLALSGAPLSLAPGVGIFATPVVWAVLGVAFRTIRGHVPRLVILAAHLSGVLAVLLMGTPIESAMEQWKYLLNAQRQIGLLVAGALMLHAVGVTAFVYFAVRATHHAIPASSD